MQHKAKFSLPLGLLFPSAVFFTSADSENFFPVIYKKVAIIASNKINATRARKKAAASILSDWTIR
jgi:hypothetical protein